MDVVLNVIPFDLVSFVYNKITKKWPVVIITAYFDVVSFTCIQSKACDKYKELFEQTKLMR